MAGELTLSGQLDALIERLKAQVPALREVLGMEELDEAMETDAMLPAAVVLFSGDYPQKSGGDLYGYPGQKVYRYWSVVLVMELTRKPNEAMDLVEAVRTAGAGWLPCRGVSCLSVAGCRFIAKFDKTRVVYEVRFVTMTTY